MQRQRLIRLLAVTALCTFCTNLRADVITALSADIAPGSTDSFSEGPFIGDTLAEPALVYHDDLAIDVLVTVDGPGNYLLAEGDFGSVDNLSGTNWTDLEIEMAGIPDGAAAAFLDGGLQTFDGDSLEFPDTALSHGGLEVDFFGGTGVPNGDFDAPQITFSADSAGTYDIRETPIASPEPGSLVLLAMGAAGLLWAARRR